MHVTTCPGCQRKVRLPENTTSRAVKTMCPKCGELLSVPPMTARHAEDEPSRALDGRVTTATVTVREVREQIAGVTASSRNLSLLGLALGLMSLLSLAFSCLTFVAYVGLGLAGVGLLIGLYAIFRVLIKRERDAPYAIGAIVVSGLALGLILTRLLSPSSGLDQGSRDDNPTLLERNKELK